jgi:hypothetical protein
LPGSSQPSWRFVISICKGFATKFERQRHAARHEVVLKALRAKDGDRAKKQFQFLNEVSEMKEAAN